MPENPSPHSVNNQLMTINRMYARKHKIYKALIHIEQHELKADIGL